MDFIQFAIILVTFVGLFIWNRTESRTDARHMDQKLESNRALSIQIHKENRELIDANRALIDAKQRETRELIDANQKETRELVKAIHAEMKDFHNRLYDIQLQYLKDKSST